MPSVLNPDPKCTVQVGEHKAPYYEDERSDKKVCSAHKTLYDQYSKYEHVWVPEGADIADFMED